MLNTPSRPGDCAGADYEIEVARADGDMAAVAYRVDAPHFLAPGSTPPPEESERPHEH